MKELFSSDIAIGLLALIFAAYAIYLGTRAKNGRIDLGTDTESPPPSDIKSDELIPGISAPLVTGGKPGPKYYCGDYMAVVTQENQSVGPISYPFIMIVSAKGSETPIMFVTAESNEMFSEMVDMLDEDQQKLLGSSTSSQLFLGVFDNSGHDNLGPHDLISDLEGFTQVALETMKCRLKLQDDIRAERRGFRSVLVEAQNGFFETFGVSKPSDAQKLKASFYLCIAGIAVLNDARGGAPPHVIDNLVADTRELVKPLSVFADDLSNSPEQLKSILSQLPSGAIGKTKLNGLAAFEAMYSSLGQDLMNDILSHNQGPLGALGYAGYVVADGIFGEGKSRENFMEVSERMLSYTKELVNVA